MALKKAITQTNGITANYHKIKNVTLDKFNYAVINIESYVNQDIREESEQLSVFNLKERIQLEQDKSVNFALLYKELKKTPTFEGAEDC